MRTDCQMPSEPCSQFAKCVQTHSHRLPNAFIPMRTVCHLPMQFVCKSDPQYMECAQIAKCLQNHAHSLPNVLRLILTDCQMRSDPCAQFAICQLNLYSKVILNIWNAHR